MAFQLPATLEHAVWALCQERALYAPPEALWVGYPGGPTLENIFFLRIT